MEKTKCSIVEAYQLKKWVVMVYSYTLFQAISNILNVRSTSASTASLSFGRTMMQALDLLWLVKRHSLDEATLNSKEIKPVATKCIAIIELWLSEGISK